MKTIDFGFNHVDRAMVNDVYVHELRTVHQLNEALVNFKVYEGHFEQFHILYAWILYFKEASAEMNGFEGGVFDINYPFTSNLQWERIHSMMENIISDPECDVSILCDRLKILVEEADAYAWQSFSYTSGLASIAQNHFNNWPNAIKRLAIMTLNMGNASIRANFRGANLEEVDMSGADVSNADFSNTNLKKALFKKVICHNSLFDNADLTGANLSSTIGTGVSFIKSNLTGARLHKAKFNQSNFQEACLDGVRALEASFIGTDFSQSSACAANFSKANFSNAKLRHVNFLEVVFEEACLNKANLYEAALDGANCVKAELIGAQLQFSIISDADFEQACLDRADLTSASAYATNFPKISAIETNFSRADLERANFANANLERAIFVNTDIEKGNFNRTHFGTKLPFVFTLEEAAVDYQNDGLIDTLFNHLENDNEGILTAIDSINEVRYGTQKRALVAQLMGFLQRFTPPNMFSIVAASLTAFFADHPRYQDHQEIAQFVREYLLPNRIEYWNKNALGRYSSHQNTIEMLLAYLVRHQIDSPDTVQSNQGVINQALVCARQLPLSQVAQGHVHRIKQAILQHPLIQQIFDTEAGKQFGFQNDEVFFINADGLSVLVCDPSLYEPIVLQSLDQSSNWDAYWFFVRDTSNDSFVCKPLSTSLKSLLSSYPLLATAYAADDPNNIRPLIIRSTFVQPMDLDDERHTKDYGLLFLQACKRGRIADPESKWLNAEDQQALTEQFESYFATHDDGLASMASPTLHAEHKARLLQSLSQAQRENQRVVGAFMLACAVLYTKASSSAIFGSETDSPYALRIYASALLKEAYRDTPDLFSRSAQTSITTIRHRSEEEDECYQNWQQRLLGHEDEFTCTAVLATMMHDHVRRYLSRSAEITSLFSEIYPAPWRD